MEAARSFNSLNLILRLGAGSAPAELVPYMAAKYARIQTVRTHRRSDTRSSDGGLLFIGLLRHHRNHFLTFVRAGCLV